MILDNNYHCYIERTDSESESTLIVKCKNKTEVEISTDAVKMIKKQFDNIKITLDYISKILFCEIGWLLIKFFEDAWPILSQNLYQTVKLI